ncbi:MAG: energy-coupling factor ABC transporter permease [Anaerolineae bacterium]|nr:energy-coupling factor ABC transporter permease [Anaerolineae bacterium]MCX8066993.1 energy-coupling factor ABC transporter permease [Anaerolineae bacterium]MDW7991279.1 energy-coupling factor ABC transporter permease [Anaerolineae bacterium]
MLRSEILPSPAAMHIPDGFLSLGVLLACWVLTLIGIGIALARTRKTLGERQVPVMGVLAAFIFAAQMLNFTIAGGTSGHFLGAALAAILLGPWAAMLTMTTVVAIQALLFQDGGLLALGANVLNMAILGPVVAYGFYRGVRTLLGNRRVSALIAGFVGAWISIVVAAIACALELGFSGTSPIGIALPAMAGIHALIGIGEGLITVGALALVLVTRPDLVEAERAPAPSGMRWVWGGLGIAIVLALLSPLASPHPDGLERVAEDLGFIERAQEPLYEVIPDYVFPGIPNEVLSTIAAGVVGTLIVYGIAVGLAALFQRRKQAIT